MSLHVVNSMHQKDLHRLRQQLLDGSKDPMVVVRGEGIILCNEPARALLRWPSVDMTGTHVRTLFSGSSLTALREGWDDAHRSSAPVQVRGVMLHRHDEEEQRADVLIFPLAWHDDPTTLLHLRPAMEADSVAKALKASENRFRSFIENVSDAIFQSTPEGKLLLVNPAFVQMLGYDSESEVLTLNVGRDIYADREDRNKLLQDLEHSEARSNVELRLKKKDGSVIVCLTNTRAVRRSSGEVWFYEGTLKDITPWRKVQDELRASQERYKAFIKQSTEGIWCFELDEPMPIDLPAEVQVQRLIKHSYLKECNSRMARMIGHSRPEDILGARMGDLFDMGEQTGQAILMEYIANGYRLENKESYFPGVDGAPGITVASSVIGIVEHDHLVRAWGTQQDITPRKEAERQLRDSEERYRQYFDDDLAGHFISEPQGRVIACNRAFARILGYDSAEDILEADPIDFYPDPRSRERVMELVRTQGSVHMFEIDLQRKDGQIVHVIENVRGTIDESGRLLQVRGFLVDITKTKQLEVQLRDAQKMETLGTLAGGVAHDFNNILTVIRGYLDLLKREKFVHDEGRSSISAIDTAVKRGAGIVRQLMTFAREERGTVNPVSVQMLLREVSELVRVTLPENVDLSISVEEETPDLFGDETQLHQALLNLVMNARDAMPSGGSIVVTARGMEGSTVRQRFDVASEDRYVCISVSDQGLGIAEENRYRLFEPFFTTKDIGKGSGLGLAVVYGVVKSHGGFVDVRPNGARGSVFHLYLPGHEPARAADPKADEPGSTTKGHETVLVVEDEHMLLDLLRLLLEGNGYSVLTATDGVEAVEIYEKHKDDIAIVLSDMGLPRMGGYEAFQRMKEINPSVRSILASGYMDPSMRDKLLSAGAMEFLQKPYVPDVILRSIREFIDKE